MGILSFFFGKSEEEEQRERDRQEEEYQRRCEETFETADERRSRSRAEQKERGVVYSRGNSDRF